MYTRYYSSLLRIGVMFWFFCKRLLCAPLVALRLGQYSLPTGYTMNVLTIENTQLPTHQEPRARFPIFLLYPKTSASRVLQRMGNILVYLQTPFANSSPLHQFLILSLSVWGLVYICVCVWVCVRRFWGFGICVSSHLPLAYTNEWRDVLLYIFYILAF